MPNRSSKPKRPRDLNQVAKLIVGISTGEIKSGPLQDKDPVAVESGRQGGLKGGPARSKALSKRQRVQIARKAAEARWKKKPS